MKPVVHFEIPTDDMERAKAFYKKALGWEFAAFPAGDGSYTMAMTTEVGEDQRPKETGKINGGMVERGELKHPVVVIDVEDAQKAVDAVREAGGESMDPVQLGDVGIYAYATDTEGNQFGLWQSLGKE